MNEEQYQIFLVPSELVPVFSKAVPPEVAAREPVYFGAEETGTNTVAGVLALDSVRDGWEILYIEVFADHRRKGIGQQLAACAADYARAMLVETLYASYTSFPEEGKALSRFFESAGFEEEASGEIRRCRLEHISDEILRRPVRGGSHQVIPLKMASSGKWLALAQLIEERAAADENPEGNVYLRLDRMDDFDLEISMLSLDLEGRPEGCVLARPFHADGYLLSYLFSVGGAQAPFILQGMISEAYHMLLERTGRKGWLYADVQNRIAADLMSRVSSGQDMLYAKSIDMMRLV